MAQRLNAEEWETNTGERYFLHPDHRNGNPEKTQWCVVPAIEVELFEVAPPSVVAADDERWGLRLVDGRLEPVGCDREFVGRFLKTLSPERWHGFPASRWPNDRVPDSLLDKWVDEERLSSARRRKLRQGIWRL